jgi:hypothetical protein
MYWRWAKALVAVVVLATCLVLQSPRASAAPSWWDGAYSGRQMLSISTVDALPNQYTLFFRFDHAALVTGGSSLASGNDVRVVRFDGATWTQIDRVLAVGSSWNTNSTEIAFQTKTTVSASSVNTEYYLYYGNAGAGSPPATPTNVYSEFDDFSGGVIDSGKWNIDSYGGGVTPVITSGQLQIAGASNFWGASITSTNGLTGPDVIVEATMTSLQQNSAAQMNSQYSISDNGMAVIRSENSVTKNWAWNFFSPWANIGQSGLQSATWPATRLGVSWTSGGVLRTYENGVQKGIRASGAPSGSSAPQLNYHPLAGGSTFDVRFDDFVVRKYVSNAPTVSPAAGVDAKVEVDPHLTLDVRARAGSCNGVSQSPGVSSSGLLASFGNVTPGQPKVVAQEMQVVTNAISGFTVYVRSPAVLTRSGGSQTIPAISGSNGSPGAFPSVGTAGFGYTTSDATLGTGTVNRFTNPSAQWAPLSTGNAEIISHPTGYADVTECVAYQVGTANATTAGTYTATVIYTLVPRF